MATQSSEGAFLGSILLGPLWIFLDDAPRNVMDGEPPLRQAMAWGWTAFHVGGSLLAGLVFPLWGAIWGAAAALVLARRICASGRRPFGLTVGDLIQAVMALPHRAWIAQVVVWLNAVVLLLIELPFAGFLGMLTVPVIVGVTGWAAVNERDEAVAHMGAIEQWTPFLASVFGVSPSIIEQGRIFAREDGGVGYQNVPAPVAIAVAPDGRGAVEQRLAHAAPHLMLHPESGPNAVWLVAVDEATGSSRAGRAASGGLFAAPVAGDREALSETPEVQAGPIIIRPEDLG